MSLEADIQKAEELDLPPLKHRPIPADYIQVIPEDSHQFFLDIDDKFAEARMNVALELCKRLGFEVREVGKLRSKSDTLSTPHYHMYLEFPRPISMPERIALQACFGSDRTKELLSLLRYIDGIDNPTVMFEKEIPV